MSGDAEVICGSTTEGPTGTLVCDRPLLHPGGHSQGGGDRMGEAMSDTFPPIPSDPRCLQRKWCNSDQAIGWCQLMKGHQGNCDADAAPYDPTRDPALDVDPGDCCQ